MTSVDPRGLEVARQYAEYYIGDSSWADMILGAYFDPENKASELETDRRG